MSSSTAAKPAPAARDQEVVLNFEPERLAAPFFLRCGALLLDYILFLLAPVSMLLLSRYFGNDGARLVAGNLNDTGWLIAVLVGATNFVLLPMFSGQSIGKMLAGIKIVRIDGRQAGPVKILLRQLLGYAITLLTGGLGFLLSLFNRSGRTLHDYLFGTVVIYADRRYK